jgi:outer membrane protein OmpA-like peptidoglycan-associated protein
MQFRRAILISTTLVVPCAVHAQPSQPVTGLYVGAGVGWNYLESTQLKQAVGQNGRVNVSVPNKSINFGSGFVLLNSVGWGFGNGLRVELEGNYRNNTINQDSSPAFRTVGTTGGSETKIGAMVNALYDLTDAFGAGFSPYVGVGFGWQHIRENGIETFGTIPTGPTAGQPFAFRTNNGQNAFAYQAIAGASYSLDTVTPGLALTAEYRFLGTAGDRTYKSQFFAPNIATGANFKMGSEYNHSILLGLRYAFNQAPPPPAVVVPSPAPAPAPARTYLVFFDWDRADLTDRARQVIAEAAQATTRVQVTRIEVSGHTDRSGTPRYNQGLSVRRAQNVASELVRLGVPRDAITVQGFGEARPLVPTADGTREPQNRRVEIVLR